MAKAESRRYVCSECGYVSMMPVGKCPSCGQWGTVIEEVPVTGRSGPGGRDVRRGAVSAVDILEAAQPERISSGIDELDRVLGGGWVEGGVALLGGQPGIGKSTLLLQVCGALVSRGRKVLYISGEESTSQVALRARRLDSAGKGLELFCGEDIDSALDAFDGHGFIVVDSVQALRMQDEKGWPGTPSQVRAVAQTCIEMAKERGVPLVLVGHITKEGRIAGPMMLEHMVDAVLLFSGDANSSFRLLRATKNRYGCTDELGIFEMTDRGLKAVDDPSGLYWNRADMSVPGVAITVLLEGSRALMAEIQALACPTTFAYPKRTSRGVSVNKIHLLAAVLERRCGISCGSSDIYANVTGGLDIRDPSADLALAAALASSVLNVPVQPDCCFLGEVGLAGEVRPVVRMGLRLREARRLGFRKAIVSRLDGAELPENMEVVPVTDLGQALEVMQR